MYGFQFHCLVGQIIFRCEMSVYSCCANTVGNGFLHLRSEGGCAIQL